jgi:hypothetical protein
VRSWLLLVFIFFSFRKRLTVLAHNAITYSALLDVPDNITSRPSFSFPRLLPPVKGNLNCTLLLVVIKRKMAKIQKRHNGNRRKSRFLLRNPTSPQASKLRRTSPQSEIRKPPNPASKSSQHTAGIGQGFQHYSKLNEKIPIFLLQVLRLSGRKEV